MPATIQIRAEEAPFSLVLRADGYLKAFYRYDRPEHNFVRPTPDAMPIVWAADATDEVAHATAILPASCAYDEVDRTLTVTFPDGSVATLKVEEDVGALIFRVLIRTGSAERLVFADLPLDDDAETAILRLSDCVCALLDTAQDLQDQSKRLEARFL